MDEKFRQTIDQYFAGMKGLSIAVPISLAELNKLQKMKILKISLKKKISKK